MKQRYLLATIAAVIPVFWHRHVEAGDLASHTYNVWLVQLVRAGKAPGLHIVRQYNNVLFDWILEGAIRVFGFNLGERLAVSGAVLIFFWGAFCLVRAISGNPWSSIPLLLMVSYGWTFEMGFLNYYLGLGISFFALSRCCRSVRSGVAFVFALLPLVWLAHPFSALILIALALYIIIAKQLRPELHPFLLLIGVAMLSSARFYFAAKFDTLLGVPDPFFLNGSDQFVLFGARYAVLAYFVVALMLATWVTSLIGNGRRLTGYALPVELYILSLLATLWLPDLVILPQFTAPLSLITVRLTTVCAVLAAGLFSIARPRPWQSVALALIGVAYFSFLYQDTARLSRAEDELARLVAPNERVIGFLPTPLLSRLSETHLIDRVCAERCFSFENYEPASQQFRLRADDGNGIVTASAPDSASMQLGTYIVRQQDLPAISVYQCGLDETDLCKRNLELGDRSGRSGLVP